VKGRYGYIVLTALSALMAGLAVLASLNQIHTNNQKFCQLVVISNLHPVPEQPKPNADSVSERAWAMYSAYNDFGHALGCPVRKP